MRRTFYLLKFVSNSPGWAHYNNCFWKMPEENSFGNWQIDCNEATLFSDNPQDSNNLEKLQKEKNKLLINGSMKESNLEVVSVSIKMENWI